MNGIKRFLKGIVTLFFPNTCLGCGEIIDEGEFFCDCCFEMLESCSLDKQCIKCGLSKKHCECKYKSFSFSGITAPFYNEGRAQRAMYTYKFRKRIYISDFFAKRISLAVKYSFHDIRFDGICYVPLSGKSLRKRGFNQSREIAYRMSEILGIPLIEEQLGCRKKKYSQHLMPKNKRFENVKGVYYPKKPCHGTVLLVDDIKTTGATLDECTKQLLKSGADAVYCAAGLISHNKYKKRKV